MHEPRPFQISPRPFEVRVVIGEPDGVGTRTVAVHMLRTLYRNRITPDPKTPFATGKMDAWGRIRWDPLPEFIDEVRLGADVRISLGMREWPEDRTPYYGG